METENNQQGKIIKKDYQGQELGAVDTNKDSSLSDEGYEFSGDAVRANPSREDEKEIDLDRSGPRYDQKESGEQSLDQQEQQQAAGIPTQNSSRGERVARRAGQNAGVEGIGTGSAQGYEGNTDDSGLPQDQELETLGSDDEIDESDIEQSQSSVGNLGTDEERKGRTPHVSHG